MPKSSAAWKHPPRPCEFCTSIGGARRPAMNDEPKAGIEIGALCRQLRPQRGARTRQHRQADDRQQHALYEPRRKGLLKNQNARQRRQGSLSGVESIDIEDASELERFG